ncbi:MAG: hypothetical protein RMY16_19730 [Nostoc sp. DedQUE12b]|uniref:hypothetical protein n=1 Tax=unclassified Nostoc TaxID=2593658 RepID=UPI002AD3845F|nr:MULTISPECIES: hypothetical protein [unclassified Nostoc]MDZ7955952.1 hypothetical protein [Nostoc sp. DedQUE09]MDZ8087774.1 hypothetical protein [Nostoc sp. DedQUE12b]
MQLKLLMSVENEDLFYTQLVKYGVESEIAIKVAQILASGFPNELLAQEEIQLVTQACKKWATLHKPVQFGVTEVL